MRTNAYVEELLGLLCPALSLASLAVRYDALAWVGLLFVWIGSGLWIIHWHRSYPLLPGRPFAKGLFSVAVGTLWPLWLATTYRAPQRSVQARR